MNEDEIMTKRNVLLSKINQINRKVDEIIKLYDLLFIELNSSLLINNSVIYNDELKKNYENLVSLKNVNNKEGNGK